MCPPSGSIAGPRPLTLTFVLVAALAASSAPSLAATVEVVLRDSAGNGLSSQIVSLRRLSDPTVAAGTPAAPYGAWSVSRTDIQGRAQLQDVPIGSYAVETFGLRGNDLLAPSENPMAPQPRITITRLDERVSVEVILARGDRMRCLMEIDREREPRGGEVRFLETVTGVRVSLPLKRGYAEKLLPPGRWQVSIVPRPGTLLRALEKNREPLPGSEAIVDVIDGGRNVDLTWSYTAPCLVRGSLSWNDDGMYPPGRIVAHLVRPGAWYEDAARRGGSQFDGIAGEPVENAPWKYEMFLPDGAWRLVPEGPHLKSAAPPFIDLELTPGQDATADFALQRKTDGGASDVSLSVEVHAPDGQRVEKARVAVWPLVEEKDRTEPLGRGETSAYGVASVALTGVSEEPSAPATGPERGFLVAAGHERFAEGSFPLQVDRFDPDHPPRATVTLGRGAVIRALARNESGAPLNAVELRVDRIGDPPRSLLKDAELEKVRAHRTAATDETGRAGIGGLDPGTYHVEPALTERRKGTHFLRIGQGDRPSESAITVTLSENQEKDLDIRLVPAASFEARLACADRGPLPPKVSVRLLPPGWLADESSETNPRTDPTDPGASARSGERGPADHTSARTGRTDATADPEQAHVDRSDTRADRAEPGVEDGDLRERAAFIADGAILTGPDRDRLFAGPFPGGASTVAVRPDTFRRWTFGPGTEERVRSVAPAFEVGKTADLGLLEIDCAPTIMVRPVARDGGSMPDLSKETLHVNLERRRSGSSTPGPKAGAKGGPSARSSPGEARSKDDPADAAAGEAGGRASEPLPDPRQEPSERSIRLRGVPEGDVRLSLSIAHPCFIPDTVRLGPLDLHLERGGEAEVLVTVPEIGGAIEIAPDLQAASAVLTDPSGGKRRAVASEGSLSFHGVVPGVYALEAFSDGESTNPIRSWERLVVERGRIIRLTEASIPR